jgi:hypothetical protein
MLRMIGLAAGVALALAASPLSAREAQKLAHACAGDIERLCAGVPPGEGRIKACMKAHAQELSAPCFDAIMGAVASEKERD